MAKTRGPGLLMVWADIDPEFEAEYHRRYDRGNTLPICWRSLAFSAAGATSR